MIRIWMRLDSFEMVCREQISMGNAWLTPEEDGFLKSF